MLKSIVLLPGLTTLIYAGLWMAAAPSKALMLVNRVRSEVGQFDRNIFLERMATLRESAPIRVTLRFAGLALILLSLIRLTEIT
jgi:hypothetical protein